MIASNPATVQLTANKQSCPQTRKIKQNTCKQAGAVNTSSRDHPSDGYTAAGVPRGSYKHLAVSKRRAREYRQRQPKIDIQVNIAGFWLTGSGERGMRGIAHKAKGVKSIVAWKGTIQDSWGFSSWKPTTNLCASCHAWACA